MKEDMEEEKIQDRVGRDRRRWGEKRRGGDGKNNRQMRK